MKLIKIFTISAVIFVASLTGSMCSAQFTDTFRSQQLGMSVHFSLTSSNKILTVGSTNLVHCQIKSLSTNQIIISTNCRPNLFTITNGSGPILLELPWQPTAITNHILNAGEKCEWEEPVIIPNDTKPKHYDLCILTWITIPAFKEGFNGVTIAASVKDIEIVK